MKTITEKQHRKEQAKITRDLVNAVEAYQRLHNTVFADADYKPQRILRELKRGKK